MCVCECVHVLYCYPIKTKLKQLLYSHLAVYNSIKTYSCFLIL